MHVAALYSEHTDLFHITVQSARIGTIQFVPDVGWVKIYGKGFALLRSSRKPWTTRAEAVLALLADKGLHFEWLVEEGEDRWLAGVGQRPEPVASAVPLETGSGMEAKAPAADGRVVLPRLVRPSHAEPVTSSTGSPLKLSKVKRA